MSTDRFNLNDPVLAAALAEVKTRLPVSQVLADAGLPVHRLGPQRLRALCPFHADSDPSLVVYDDRRFYCFGCGAKGDVVDLVKGIDEHPSFVDALRAAAERAGVFVPDRVAAPDPTGPLFAAAMEAYAGLLTPQAVQYLAGRGFPEAFVRAKQIGYAPERPKAFLAGYLRANGLSLQAAAACGLVVRTSSGQSARDAFATAGGGYLVFPVRRGPKVVDLQGRAWPEAPGKPKYLNLPGERLHLFGEDHLAGPWVVLCEGVPDALSAEVAGIPAAASFGTRAFRDGFVPKFRRCQRIYVAYDRDATLRGAEVACSFGVRGRVLLLPDDLGPKGDLNDLLVSRGSDGFRAEIERLLKAAPTGYQVRINVLQTGDLFDLYSHATGLLADIQRLDPISRQVHLQHLADRTGLPVRVVEEAGREAARHEAELSAKPNPTVNGGAKDAAV
ncbi:MAG: CHC2 zinc finger domain-containing protein [bacterium]|nr:CHC2 zinc finger domain-containing protein [bacterium]